MSQPASALTSVFPDPPKIYKNKKGAGRPKKAATIAREAGEEQPDVVGELPAVRIVSQPEEIVLKAMVPEVLTTVDEMAMYSAPAPTQSVHDLKVKDRYENESYEPTHAEEVKFHTDKGKERIFAPERIFPVAPETPTTKAEPNLAEAPKEDVACVSDGECNAPVHLKFRGPLVPLEHAVAIETQNQDLRSFGQRLSLFGAGMSMAAFVVFRYLL